MKTIRFKIREIAEAQGMNASQLGRKADVSQTTMYDLWNNRREPQTRTLIALATALGVRVVDLIEEEDTQSHEKIPPALAPAA